MADIGITIAAKITEYLVDPMLQHARYIFSFNKFVRNLQHQKEKLILTKTSVDERKKEARRKTEVIDETVERWVNEVRNVLEEVEKLEAKVRENKSCYRGPFRYFLAKEVARVTEKMMKLKNYTFEHFSRGTELPGMKYFSSQDFVYSKSTEHAYEKLMEALKDGNNHMIGLHGMGGAGKSTLVKEVGKKAEELHLFDKVVMAIVSRNPEVTNIQGQIADHLDLILREETPIGRAQRLSTSLQNERTLVILDDVWQKLDFEAIGIPPCCTVLLTTRRRDTCIAMNCQITVELSLLDEEEAWTLFKQCAGIIDGSPYALKLKNVPRKIAKKCKGLPIAIVTMASMLKGKKVEEWELALLRLEESHSLPMDVEEDLSSPYACIKLSYDNLTKQVYKSLFLLCSMFPEGFEINVEDLVRYMKGLGPAAGTVGTMEKVRREIQVAVHTLRDSYLLQPSDQKEFVKMHDMVRDVAVWIASKEGKVIKVATKSLAIVDENIEDLAAMSLWAMENLPTTDQLQFPKLQTLLLHSTDESSLQVPNAYFGGMETLEVLGIIKFYYTWRNLYTLHNLSSSLSILTMPQSIERLTMLRSLCLRGYELGDISVLASLTRLEVLDLRSSSFYELPQGIIALKKLRLLDIYTCRIKKNNPYEVRRECTQLEELYIWRVEDDSLDIVSLPSLQRYVIVCDKFRENCRFLIDAYLEDHVPSRAMCIEGFDASGLIHETSSIKDLFLRAEHLYLGHLRGGCKNIIPHMDRGGMTELTGLILESCSEIECLVDTTLHANFPAFFELVTLKLIWMNGLEEVFRDPTSQCSLEKLEDLQIEYCVQLHSISFPSKAKMCNLKILRLQWCPMLTSSLFIPTIARSLVLLEELKLFDCSKLKHVIAEDDEQKGNGNDSSHTLKVFPNLRILLVHGCQKLESIFPVSFAQGLEKLKKIAIWYNFGLKYVFGTHKNHNDSGNEAETEIKINLPALTRISLVSLSNLIDICPRYCHARSPNLKDIEYRDCPQMSTNAMCKTLSGSDMQQGLTATEDKVIFPATSEVLALERLTIEQSMVEGIFQLQVARQWPLNSNLSHLYLKDQPELRFIWSGPKNLLSLQKLKCLVLVRCKNLETIFSPTVVGSLAELSELVVSKCEKLEHIISSDHAKGSEQVGKASACPISVFFPALSILHVFQCNNLKSLFSHSLACPCPYPELEFITVEECSQIQHVFDFSCEAASSNDDKGHRVGRVPDENSQPLALPKLREVKLTGLPNLTKFCRGPKEFQPKVKLEVKHYTVKHCPKYTSSWLQNKIQEKSQTFSTPSQTSGQGGGMILGPGSSSASAAISGGGGGASEPHIQERVLNLEIQLESESQRRRLMELDLQVERERRRLIELKLEAAQERWRIMEGALLSVFDKMIGRVPQQFATLLSQIPLAPNEGSEDQVIDDVSIQSS